MDHRCLYGHRVPAAFTFAIQSRACPTCGAPTVTVEGYQLARKLAAEVGIEAVTSFNAVRFIEGEYVLQRVADAAASTPAPSAAAAPVAEEEVVVEDTAEVSAAAVVAAQAQASLAAAPPPPPPPAAAPVENGKPSFEQDEEAFFKTAES